ncbi:MAG TPA: permease-like cell division protein FtsX [Candidatus Obscuribacterales bacterium]
MAADSRTFHQIGFALGQGAQNMLRSPFMSLIVISTMMIALGTLGFLLLVLSDLNSVSAQLSTQLKIVVFLEDQQDPTKLATDIEALQGVAPPVNKISREQALESMTKENPELKELLKQNNPFPATLEVSVMNTEQMDEIGAQIRQMPGVEEVQFNQDLAEQLQQVQSGVQLVGSIIAGILILATLAIVVNTIQLAVHQRHQEIEIMRLVGAPQWFIRLPFLLEGLIFGIFSSILATLLLVFWRLVPYSQLQHWFSFLPLPDSLLPLVGIAALLLVTGILMGMLGSALSVHRYLRLEFRQE